MPAPLPTVTDYACTACQARHVRELDPDLYAAHLLAQSRHHGPRRRRATPAEALELLMRQEEPDHV